MGVYTSEAAAQIGVSRATLLRWFRQGKIREVKRNVHGWRIFESEDIEQIKTWYHRETLPDDFRQRKLFEDTNDLHGTSRDVTKSDEQVSHNTSGGGDMNGQEEESCEKENREKENREKENYKEEEKVRE